MQHVEFEVGQRYKNRKGTYEVLSIDGDVMHIRWKAGEEIATTVTMQSRILDNMQHELDHPALTEVPSPRRKTTASSNRRRVQRS